jgi:hypothetical protein
MQTRSGLTRRNGEQDTVELYYEDLGEAGDPAVLLIMGLGAQLPMWPDGFCAQREAMTAGFSAQLHVRGPPPGP